MESDSESTRDGDDGGEGEEEKDDVVIPLRVKVDMNKYLGHVFQRESYLARCFQDHREWLEQLGREHTALRQFLGKTLQEPRLLDDKDWTDFSEHTEKLNPLRKRRKREREREEETRMIERAQEEGKPRTVKKWRPTVLEPPPQAPEPPPASAEQEKASDKWKWIAQRK
jgi:hypothetical protein